MGADIHFFTEKYNKESNQWEYICLRDKDENIINWYVRNYELFGMLAGVRADELDGFTQVKGLPRDFDESLTKVYDNNDYFHSATWYTMAELLLGKKCLELTIKEKQLKNEDAGLIVELEYSLEVFKHFIYFIDLIAYYNGAYDANDVRVTVWFDN